jgi:hypothetical protein
MGYFCCLLFEFQQAVVCASLLGESNICGKIGSLATSLLLLLPYIYLLFFCLSLYVSFIISLGDVASLSLNVKTLYINLAEKFK